MPSEFKQYLKDILAAADHIAEFTAGMSRNQYESTYLVQSAVERQFMIVGEAMSMIREFYPEQIRHFEDAHKIVAFRNVLAHEYNNVDANDVWSALRQKLPEFRDQVAAVLDEMK